MNLLVIFGLFFVFAGGQRKCQIPNSQYKHKMEFTEPFPINFSKQSTLGSSTNALYSPNSQFIATSEHIPPSKKTSTLASDLNSSWLVSVVETAEMSRLQTFEIILPGEKGVVGNSSIGGVGGKRPFRPGGKSGAKSTEVTAGSRVYSQTFSGTQLKLIWSPNSQFILAWPPGTSYIYIIAVTSSTVSNSTGSSVVAPLLRCHESDAVGISNITWLPNSTGFLTTLQYGMGVKYWRLDNRFPVHLFPYPKSSDLNILDFSTDGKFLAILHRRDATDHIAIYSKTDGFEVDSDVTGMSEESTNWQVLHWLKVPEDMNVEGVSFAKGAAAHLEPAKDQVPLLYAWESVHKFRFVVYSPDGSIRADINNSNGNHEDFEKQFNSFGIRKWIWSQNGRIAACLDARDSIHLWNAIIHKVIGTVDLESEKLKAAKPIVFREQIVRGGEGQNRADRVKYDASFTFPMQSQILSTTAKSTDQSIVNFSLSADGEYLTLHNQTKYPNCLWVFSCKSLQLKSLLVQLSPILDFSWHPQQPLLALTLNSDHLYFWQPEGTHCVPYPAIGFTIKSAQWSTDQKTMLLVGQDSYCLGIPDVLNESVEVDEFNGNGNDRDFGSEVHNNSMTF